MANSFQDDDREHAMRQLFQLDKDDAEGRSGIDAHLDINGVRLPFELKTTSKGSVTTVRDFGYDHIEKWQDKHWLIGFFVKGREYYKYGSPAMMKPWINTKEEYIRPDFEIANIASEKIGIEDMHQILGKKSVYSYDDARKLQKKQYTKEQYYNLQDQKNGYSPERMLEITRERARYLVKRGSTLNNPHIPFSYFKDWEEITTNHAQRLRELVRQHLT